MNKREAEKEAKRRKSILENAVHAAWLVEIRHGHINDAIHDLATLDRELFTPEDDTVRGRAVTAVDAALGELPAIGRRLAVLRQTLDPDGLIVPASKPTVTGVCRWCGDEFTRTRADAVFCSSKCRQAAYRLRLRPKA